MALAYLVRDSIAWSIDDKRIAKLYLDGLYRSPVGWRLVAKDDFIYQQWKRSKSTGALEKRCSKNIKPILEAENLLLL